MTRPTFDAPGPNRRRDLIRRTQVGVTGLVLVAMLVGLSTLLTGEAREDVAAAEARAEAAGAPPATATTGEDPMANLGAAPAVPAPSVATDTARPAAAPPQSTLAPAVPDLQPDPRLQRPAAR